MEFYFSCLRAATFSVHRNKRFLFGVLYGVFLFFSSSGFSIRWFFSDLLLSEALGVDVDALVAPLAALLGTQRSEVRRCPFFILLLYSMLIAF